MMEARRDLRKMFKVLRKKKTHQPKILDPENYPSKVKQKQTLSENPILR